MLQCISPVDGRYADQTRGMALFSEKGMIHLRIQIELAWLKHFSATIGTPIDPSPLADRCRPGDVKDVEAVTRHDIKAIEYVIRECMADDRQLRAYTWMVHFGLTSEDVSNLAYGIAIRETRHALLHYQDEVINRLLSIAEQYKSAPMLAHTHGQPASPTTFGKEMAVFAVRLRRQQHIIGGVPIYGKLAGASGNFNALVYAYPHIDWHRVAYDFVSDRGLEFTAAVTQIEPHDGLSELFDAIARFNTVMVDLCRDMWQYMSMEYLSPLRKEGEVGSSTMPHKVNPIDFENAEGNCGISSALLRHLSATLPVSRMQRDLTDSTAMRNIGVALSHHLIALRAVLRGLERFSVDTTAMEADIRRHPEVMLEGLQTLDRATGNKIPYEEWIRRSAAPMGDYADEAVTYTGMAAKLTERLIGEGR